MNSIKTTSTDNLNIFYNYNYVSAERLENKYLNENKATYDSISRRPPMYITGTVFHDDVAIQTFSIDEKNVFNFNLIENQNLLQEVYCTDGSIDLDSGEITLYWASKDLGKTHVVVNYEYPIN